MNKFIINTCLSSENGDCCITGEHTGTAIYDEKIASDSN